MSNWSIWGSEIKSFRKKADMTQGKLIEQLSMLVSELTDQEHHSLDSIHLVQEITTYFGGILDTPTLSKLERGKRVLSSRKRVLAFIWGFKKIGALTTIEEAEHLLELSGYGGRLTDAESAVLFSNIPPITHAISYPDVSDLKKGSLSENRPTSTHETADLSTNKQQGSNRTPLITTLLIALLIGSGGVYWWVIGRDTLPPPALTEDFSDPLDAMLWSMEDAPHSSLENKRLLFDSPVNDDPKWISEGVWYLGEKQVISRIKFEISVDTPETYKSGSLGLLTNCLDGRGWMNLYAGQQPPHLFVEYATKDEIDNWEEDVNFVDVMDIERGEVYAVDLRWVDDALHVSVEESGVAPVIIPCNRTSHFHIHTSLSQGEKIRGFIDQLQIWR